MIGVGLIAVEYGNDVSYIRPALKAVDYWSAKYPVVVWTNQPEKFADKKCTVITYTESRFNFHDKIKLLEVLSIDYELSILMDCNKIPNKNVLFNETKFKAGLHSSNRWNENWYELNQLPLVNGVSYWKHWDECLNISKLENPAVPICERTLILKRHRDFKKFVDLVQEKYRPVATENDRLMGLIDPTRQGRIDVAEGRAEGFSYALAAKELKFPLFCPSPVIEGISTDLKRLDA